MNVKAIICLLWLSAALNSIAEFRAGIAVRNVTPDPLLPVSGGVGPSHAVTRKEGELTVRALVLEQEDTRVAMVSADFLGFPAALGERVRAAVTNIPRQNILIGATHTHSAPDCYGFPDGKGGTASDRKYLASVCVRMAEAINEDQERTGSVVAAARQGAQAGIREARLPRLKALLNLPATQDRKPRRRE